MLAIDVLLPVLRDEEDVDDLVICELDAAGFEPVLLVPL